MPDFIHWLIEPDFDVTTVSLRHFPVKWEYWAHRNTSFRLWLIQAGKVKIHYDHRMILGAEGDLLLLPAAKEMYFENVSEGPLHMYSVIFQQKNGPRMGIEGLFQDQPVLKEVPFDHAHRLLEEMEREYRQAQIGFSYIVKSRLYELVIQAVRARMPQQVPGFGGLTDARLATFLKMLVEQPQASFSSAGIAAYLQVSEPQSRRIFHNAFGCSPLKFVNRYKIDCSKKLLRETQRSISEISDSLGFDNPNYYAKVFRQFCGMSPKEFRRLDM